MPKIVDHKAHSQDLALRAAKYFSDHGYAGTSMRKVAAYLGLSKSALYHYFPTKEHLFLACTRQVMGGLDRTFIDATASDEENLAQLKEVLRKDFASEMGLVFEYLRGKSSTEIANDEAMQVATVSYTHLTLPAQPRWFNLMAQQSAPLAKIYKVQITARRCSI